MPSTQTTLRAFFGAPKTGLASQAAPRATPKEPTKKVSAPQLPPSSSPASTLRTPPSDPVDSPVANASKRARRASPVIVNDDDEPLTPPPVETKAPSKRPSLPPSSPLKQQQPLSEATEDAMDVDDASPFMPQSRRTKRKIIYAESDSDSDGASPAPKAKGRPRKSLKVESDDDEFVFDEADEAAMAAAVDDYEAGVVSEAPSPSPSVASTASPVRKPSKKFVAPKAAPKKPTTSWNTSPPAGPSRPSRENSGGASSGRNDSSNFLLTAAERKKIEAKEDKQAKETCFSFLVDIKDKEGRRPDHPDYDPRTIHIPRSAWDQFTPFEKQFWEIKQNHYDTVLFFQKGKFYELYENDAAIGHQEFDLKLTDRVKMKMVGVPEQSFEFWAAKFLGAGYKVGKVEQTETAIGMEMRSKTDAKSKASKPAGREIVRRELAQVFTNGTIVDGTYLNSDEANHCVSIKEWTEGPNATSSFGICIMDASTGEFNLSAFDDDVCRTRLETMFRQIRPKELVYCQGNLSVNTTRLLRSILPPSTAWQSFKEAQTGNADDTLASLDTIFDADGTGETVLPEAISSMTDKPLAMESLGIMVYYLQTLNLDKDLISQRNFNVYDPIKNGKCLVLDGQTLSHMEVLVNGEGGHEGTLLQLLQRCLTPFGKRLFRIWLTSPLKDAVAINDRLNAVDDLMSAPTFSGQFTNLCKGLPDLERLLSRIHSGSIRVSDFLKVVENFDKIHGAMDGLNRVADQFESPSVRGLLRSAPDLGPLLAHIHEMFTVDHGEKTIDLNPTRGANQECDDADDEIARIEGELDGILRDIKRKYKVANAKFWHSAQGNKEIYQIEVPASFKPPSQWTKCSNTKSYSRWYTPETLPAIREIQEARETQSVTRRMFFKSLLAEFDKDRLIWLKMIRIIAELDCLVSLAKASNDMDEPKCRPEFVESEEAFVDFESLRHPSMCLQRDFIANDVQLGGDVARTTLLTGPNMAGKSTLLRMTAAGVILAQLGCYVPAARARLSPIDRIQTRMGAYDNMFASASTFKVELDECSKILREAGPRSLVILDELGRGTSTFDGMAIAGAVLHHLSTHTLPLGFFATHYGSLTDDFAYHPNVRNMHMQVHVDDDEGVVFLYKLIKGHAESSHGTHVAKLAGVPQNVIARADEVSAQFFEAFKDKLASRRQSSLSVMAQSDVAWLLKLATTGTVDETTASVSQQLDVIRRAAAAYAA
ncbi:DNA mismatch repair protein msh6 [Vanrija albida]|uniref:DNA mismatch repair protein n=1 Tax=Vanrija albida TaxID=181172 RepID=A0ABR3QCJ0_9TREE